MIPDATIPAQRCPDRGELAAFTRGRLSDEELELIAEHLSHCSSCESSAQGLRDQDAILALLRRPAPSGSKDDSVCLRLAERARAIPAELPITPTVSDAVVADAGDGPALPARFCGYLLLQRLGSGGMGIVYKARQQSLKRLVALKMVKAGIYASAEERLRFRREGESIARVEHPHIVKIYELGECAGQLYFSMELLEGGTLADRLKGSPLPPREAAELVRTLALAVQAAHQQGVVHRDLKPANVLFAAEGTIHITDFGLAKLVGGEDSQTQTDAILGTPSYMAPEQARGDNQAIGPATDVYALGTILYELLTGQPPFRADTRLQTLELVRTSELKPPSRLRPGLARDLEAICLKCLHKQPVGRYSSAEELADDLRRWLDGRPTKARPPRWTQTVYRTVRRHPLIGAACLLVGITILFAPLFRPRDPQIRLRAIEARLHRGQAVTLIEDKGGPAWSNWEVGRGIEVASRQGDGAFTLNALNSSALILLPDPQRSYRFSAEVRHEKSTRGGQVGLCVASSRHTTSAGWQRCLGTFGFDDFSARYPHPKTGQFVSRVRFILWRISESEPVCIHDVDAAHFTPAAVETPRQYPWRPMAVEVRPEGIDLFWGNEEAVHLTHKELVEMFKNLKRKRDDNPAVERFPELQPGLGPRDGLGLYVHQGQAAFRRVRVEPLIEP